MRIDLNGDMGEGMGHDAAMMPFISSANIACGYHAGNEATLKKTIELCLKHNVAIGAHPGFADKPNFGRTPIYLTQTELYQLILEQLAIMQKCCDESEAILHHVKPHGALYNMAALDEQMSLIICKAVYDFNPQLIFYGLSGSAMITAAKAVGLAVAQEAFADRTYQADGALTPRWQPNALITEPRQAVNQVMQIITQQSVTATGGEIISIEADTICLHGDGEHAVDLARDINQALVRNGVSIKSI
jgi:5-oxoprolinase (ATP-hydrolysing) subunit A